jgi:hypothetical protein
MLKTELDISGVTRMLDALPLKKQKTAIRRGVKDATKPLTQQYKQTIKAGLKTTNGIGGATVYNDKTDPLGVIVSIKKKNNRYKKNFLLTIYELGTYKSNGRWNTKKGRKKLKKPRWTGRIAARGWFSSAVSSTESTVFRNLKQAVSKQIVKTYRKMS